MKGVESIPVLLQEGGNMVEDSTRTTEEAVSRNALNGSDNEVIEEYKVSGTIKFL